ncbi:glycosyltransferase family 2 protein [Aureisphaera sp. CAU 1614]|uniref:Glycosyltransferase family 2 protein n=1 Tax=Halomarinibacterium sedimenti TaxID=2857106 RepID=A0A9X1JX40_9FLAO|nr:glycosyltransferase family 2 protein [Halomarinibacterium sedimenti]MBW2937713.1 glycosyltransferase family 2 protein [Halomarinibacterium sedimenti]
MRIGTNPAKENNKMILNSYHRIIVPVFIPNLEEDYFKDSFDILKINLESILLTIHDKTRVSIYNNGSCKIVSDYLNALFSTEDKVDQYLISKVNIGKINAIYSIVKSNLEPLFTITDADVFFKSGWQQEVEKVFENFPKAGIVSPVPFSTMFKSNFGNLNYWEAFVRSKLKVIEVPNPEGLRHFEESIGRKMFKETHYKQFISLVHKNGQAVLGSGHFVCTVRTQIFRKGPNFPTQFKMGGKVMTDYIDKPNNDAGFLRLATVSNGAYHMGNRIESWMLEEIKELKKATDISKPINERINFNVKPYSIVAKWLSSVFYKLFLRTSFGKRLFLKYVGIKDPDY